jgi:hypothetical protein
MIDKRRRNGAAVAVVHGVTEGQGVLVGVDEKNKPQQKQGGK